MSAEFYIVFDDPAWYEQNRATLQIFIQSLATFKKNVDDQEYWLRGEEAGGDWDYGARIYMRSRDMLLEVSSHPPSIVSDIKYLNGFISKNTNSRFLDDDGETIDDYTHFNL